SFIRHVLDDQFEFPKQTLPRLWQEKKRIAKRLKINTDANFFCMTVPELPLLKSRLFQEKIAVRDCASFGLESSIRFCIGKEEDNNRLLQVLENHVEGAKKEDFIRKDSL
ncbi:MAG: aminotransferase class I/II-fold pyridoxal phosphate-dependent enzyme, partial [Thermotogota bacterium]|nr:aminotransferase class I/II-fold pyridoxal phosphate-dependent enzyme [Thermotogota bacterium]